jgi:Tfp pilus assembly protein FimT
LSVKMRENKFNSQSGISLTETLIVLVIATIIVTLAVSQFGQSKDKLLRQNIVREFKIQLERARSDSIKRHAAEMSVMSYVEITGEKAFNVMTDINQNGTLDTSELKSVKFPNNNIKIVGNNLVYPIKIRFDNHGFMTATNGLGTTITPSFTICDGCSISTASSSNANIISVSTTGTVLMSYGGEGLQALQTPEVSLISSSSQIKPDVVVTPVPTPTSGQPCQVILFLCV